MRPQLWSQAGWLGSAVVCLYVLLQALGLYREVIKAQPDNIYAVNGIGTCLAGEGAPRIPCTGGRVCVHG